MQNNIDTSYLTPIQNTPEIEQLSEKIRVNTPQLPKLNNPFESQSAIPSFDNLINQGVDRRVKTIDYSTPFLDVYKPLNSGEYVSMYEKYIPNIDNQERLAQEQTSWDKVSNGILKFGTKTGNAVLGGTVGIVYGIGSAISNGQGSSIYDNKFSNWLNDLDVKMNYQLPNYYTKQEQEKGLGGQMLTTNFWADKFLGGLAFTAGAIVSEGIWAWATGGTSLASSGARLGTKVGRALKWGAEGAEDTAQVLSGMSKMKALMKTVPGRMYQSGAISKDLAIGFAKTAELGNLARFAMTSAGYESSVEALQFKKEAEEKFLNNFENLNGRQPTSEEKASFYKELDSSANSVFLTNMAIVGSSNLVTMGKIFNLKSPVKTGITEFLEKKAFGVGIDKTTGEILKQTAKQKAAKGFFDYIAKPSLTEGLFEEGLQGVTNKTANKWMEHTYSPSASHENLDLTGMIYDSVAEQYGSKEGWVENGLGMIIGIVGGARNSYSGNKETQRELEYKQAVGKTFDQKTIQGELIIPQRLQAMNRMSGFSQESQEEAKKGNIVKSQLAQNDVLLSFINAKLSLGDSIKDTVKEVSDSLEAVSPAQWAEAGIENVEDYKKETISEFERIAKSYDKNKTYWQYMIGRKLVGEQNLPEGVLQQAFGAKLSPNQVIIDSLTWNSVRGENAAKFMDDMQSVLTNELGIENGKTLKTISKLLGTKGNLTKTLNSNRALYNSLNLERDALVKEIEVLNNAPKETEGQDTQKKKLASLSNSLLEVNSKITEVNARIEDVASQINQAQQNREALEGVDLSGNLADSYISGQDLINLEENIKKFKATLEYVKSTDQQRGQYLEDMMDEYQQAQEVFMLHQASSKMATEAKLENINTWIGGKFLKKNKSMDLDAMEWFTEVATKYQNSKAESYNKFKKAEENEAKDDLEIVEKPADAPNDIKVKTREQEIQDEIAVLEQEREEKLKEVISVPIITKEDIEKRRQKKYNAQDRAINSGQILDNQGEPVYGEDKGIGANGLATLTDKEYGHGHNRTSGLNSLKVLENLLDGSDFSGMFGKIRKKANETNPYTTWESSNFVIVSNNSNPTTNNKLNLNEIEVILNVGLSPFAQELVNKYPNVTFKDFNGKKYDAELAALNQPNNATNVADIERRRQEKLDSIKINTADFTVNKNRPIAPDVITEPVQANRSILGALNNDFSEKRINEYEALIKKSQTSDKQKSLILTELEKIKINAKYDAELVALQTEVEINKKYNQKITKLQQELKGLKSTPQDNLVEQYKKKIASLLKGTYEFLGKDIGSSYMDISDKKPTSEEIEKYRELKKEGQEDTPEFKALERKLQNWKLLDTMVDSEYMSVAEMVDIVDQHEKEVSKEETKTEITEEEVESIWDGASDSYDDTLLQNTTANVTAKMMPNGDIRFSHLKLATIHERLGGEITIGNKVATAEDLEKLKAKPGKEVAVSINGLKMTLDSSGRIAMRYTDYISSRQALNMYILNPTSTNWTYKSVSEWNGEETVKLSSDFVEDINSNDLYELQKGDEVTFVLYNEDGFNDEMHKKLSKEEFQKVIKIMVVKDGKNISVVKAAQDTSNGNLLYLREKAYEAYINKLSKILGTTTVEQVYLGSPEIKMNENGAVQEIPISQEASERVVKATGFIQNGQVTTSVVFAQGELNTSFLDKIAEKNKDMKVPFVVIQRGIHLLAYPVTMVKAQDSRIDEFEKALKEPTIQKQVIAVNNLIDKYKIQIEKVFPENLQLKEDELRKAFEENLKFLSMEEFTSSNYDFKNLKDDVTINIDLDNIEKAISDAKVRISLDDNDIKINIPLDTKNIDKTEIETMLSDIALELINDYTQNADTKYLYSKGKNVGNIIEDTLYTDTLDDTPPTEAKSQLDKIRNMNILRKALGYDIAKKEAYDKLPSEIKDIITKERLQLIDDLLKSYDRIQKQTTVNKNQAQNGANNIC